jgi:hypothetical protein
MDMNQIQQRYQQFMANQPNNPNFGNQNVNPNMGNPGLPIPGMNPGGPMQPMQNNPVMAPDAQQQARREALAQQLMQGTYQNTMNPQSVGGQQARLGAGNAISGLAQQFAAGNRYAQNNVTPNSIFQKDFTPDTFDAADAANMKNVGAMRTNRFAGML